MTPYHTIDKWSYYFLNILSAVFYNNHTFLHIHLYLFNSNVIFSIMSIPVMLSIEAYYMHIQTRKQKKKKEYFVHLSIRNN